MASTPAGRAAEAIVICIGVAIVGTALIVLVANAVVGVPRTYTRLTVDADAAYVWPPRCAPPRNRDEASLCASWQSANAATETERWTAAGVFISLAGFAFVVGGLWLNRKQLETATKALEIERALVLPDEAHVVIGLNPGGDDKVNWDNSWLNAGLRWKNFGNRPAIQLKGFTTLEVREKGAAVPIMPSYSPNDSWESLGVDEQRGYKADGLEGEAIIPILAADVDLYLFGLVSYRDRMDPEKIVFKSVTLRALLKPVDWTNLNFNSGTYSIRVPVTELSRRRENPAFRKLVALWLWGEK